LVEVFRTNVEQPSAAAGLTLTLRRQLPKAMITFDLEDCDRVLRVEAAFFSIEEIKSVLHAAGFRCEPMED
jgi:hypothetical protein